MASDPADQEIKTIDLFSGCGGLTEGFRSYIPDGASRSPFHPIAAVEMETAAAATYQANFGADESAVDKSRVQVSCDKIEDWDPKPYANRADVILGGPPCQGFSGLGNGDPKGEKNHLWREYMRVVQIVRPKVFVMENVDRFLRSPEYAMMQAAANDPDGELYDYHIEPKILNAADFGVPQRRMRVIVMATRRDLLDDRGLLLHPQPTHASPAKTGRAVTGESDRKPWLTVGESVFAHTRAVVDGIDLEARPVERWEKRLSGPYATAELHVGRRPTQRSLLRYAAIPAGGNRFHLPDELSTVGWRKHLTGSGDVMGRLRWDEPSVTIRTEFYKPEKGRYLHPTEDRPITHLEAAMIQGFPMDFQWFGSKTQIARQIGNAVPIGLGRALAEAVHVYLAAGNEGRPSFQPTLPIE